MTLARAKAIADEWADQASEAARTATVCGYFDEAEPADLIRMWETGHNMLGGKLTQFEFVALCEAWCRVFGALPPDE